MRLLDLTLSDPATNLALDEALLLEAEATGEPSGVSRRGEALRLWESASYAVIVGAGGSVAYDVNLQACEEEGVPVLRRASGGGTVLLGPGCLCFSLVLRTDRALGLEHVQPSTRYVLDRTLNAIRTLVPDARIEGTSDLAVSGVKFSGSAQQRKRRFFLHHGTLLAGFDLPRLSRYLKPPEREPAYRQGRQHGEFVMNLPATIDELKRRLIVEWEAKANDDPLPMKKVNELISEKYSREEWSRRR